MRNPGKPTSEVRMQTAASRDQAGERPPGAIAEAITDAIFDTTEDEIRNYARQIGQEVGGLVDTKQAVTYVTAHDVKAAAQWAAEIAVLKAFDLSIPTEQIGEQ